MVLLISPRQPSEYEISGAFSFLLQGQCHSELLFFTLFLEPQFPRLNRNFNLWWPFDAQFIRAFGPTLVTIRETFTECPGPNSGIVIVG